MNNIQELLKSLRKIENELEKLSHDYAELYQEYDGQDFIEQNELAANKLDNLILVTTHEVATQIGFDRQKLHNLTNYISFRKMYKNYTSEELEMIIDNQSLSSNNKLKLQNKIDKNILPEIQAIKTSWNELFGNKSYQTIKLSL